MDAGTSTVTNKARLRQQILDGEQDIDSLSQSLNQQQQYLQQQQQQGRPNRYQPAYMQNQQYLMNPNGSHANSITSSSTTNYNYDMMTPLPQSGSPYTTNSNASYSNIAASSSRKSSLTSQSAAGRFFRRHTKGNVEFNEDSGVDIQDLTNLANVSFDDITHMRDRGPYGAKSLDTAPIIPTLGSGGLGLGPASGGPAGAAKINNVQYRKQMNQQKKLAMLNGARANSLAGGNPMMMQQQHPQQQPMGMGPGDPRTMSMVNPNPRTMSLNSQGPRTMSMRSGPFPQQQQQQQPYQYNPMGGPQNGPRAMSLKTGPYPQNQMHYGGGMPNNGPRTMSLMNGGVPPNHPNYGMNMMPQNYPRTKSLGGQGTPMGYQGPPLRSQQLVPAGPPQQYQQQYQQQHPPQQHQSYPQQPIQQSFAPGQQPFAPRNPQYGSSQSQQSLPQSQQYYSQPQSISSSHPHSSNDSLGQVVEEDEEEYPRTLEPKITDKRDNNEDDDNDDDVIYRFENEDPASTLSRKSTLKKNNSMRVRKLNLFNDGASQTSGGKKTLTRKKPPVSPEDEKFETRSSIETARNKDLPAPPVQQDEHEQQEDYDEEEDDLNELSSSSPKFNVGNQPTRESYLEYDDIAASNEGYKSLGANARTSTHDVFVTALDFQSPQKSNNSSTKFTSPQKKSMKHSHSATSGFPSPDVESGLGDNDMDEQSTIQEESESANTSIGRNTSITKDSDDFNPIKTRNVSLSEQGTPKLRNIVANTAFSNFRSPSTDSSSQFANPSTTSNFTQRNNDSSGSSIYDESAAAAANKLSKLDLNYSDTDDSELPKTDNNGFFEQSTNGETTPPTSSTSNVSHKPIEKLSSYEDKLTNNPQKQSFYENFTEPITDIPQPPPSSQPKESTSVVVNTKDVVEDLPSKITRRTSSGEDLKSFIPSYPSRTPSGSLTPNKRSSISLNGAKNIFKRFSKSGKRASSIDDGDTSMSMSSRTSSITQTTKPPVFNRRVSSTGTLGSLDTSTTATQNGSITPRQPPSQKPLTFTKEEMAIMNCNSDLLNELELVTTELASSIKRELALESRIKNNGSSTHHQSPSSSDIDLNLELSEKSKTIAELQEKLSKERRLRFISEEHALLGEHGQTPSPLKLNYEKTELYKQLLIKNDLVNQLEDKLSEYERRNGDLNDDSFDTSRNFRNDSDLIERYNELLKENTDLKLRVIPNLETQLVEKDKLNEFDESKLEIQTLKTQRDELREVVNKLTSHNNNELKVAHDRIKQLESKLSDMKKINNKLSTRSVSDSFTTSSSGSITPSSKSGGKLNGFAVISPNKKLFDD
ncbi:hypothetical protein SBY92_001456 [Candida maltosa Xu316]